MTRTAIYVRISDDRVGAGLGVMRQEKECRAYAAKRGWTVTRVFADNDISAYSGKHRPGYVDLFTAAHAREFDALVVWHVDRLTRQPRELEDVIDLADEVGLALGTVTGEIDLSTPTGRMVARIMGVTARHESEHKSARIRSKHRELAENGKLVGGGSRPFGYQDDRKRLRVKEARLVRGAAERVIDGTTTLHGVCREWNTKGIKTPTGREWTPHVVRRMLMSTRISGRREHKGVITSTSTEWDAIITPEQSDQLRTLLSNPERTTNDSDGVRRYLLSGYLWCGQPGCTDKLRARPQGDHQRSYVCADIGRAHLRVHAESVELYVTEAAFDYLDEFVHLAAALQETQRAGSDARREADLWSAVSTYQQRIETLEQRFWVDGKVSEATYERNRAALARKLEEAQRHLGQLSSARTWTDLPTSSAVARKLWPDRDLHWRRRLIGALVERVTVGPAVRGRNTFDPTRISVKWRKPA